MQMTQVKETAFVKDCTFTPKINNLVWDMSETKPPIQDRLIAYSEKIKAKKIQKKLES